MKLKYSSQSVDDLQRVIEFIEHKNPYAARRIAVDIQEGMDRLKQFPEIGLPVLKARESEKIRDLFVGNYTVRYLITEDTIYVLRVWHNKENEKK